MSKSKYLFSKVRVITFLVIAGVLLISLLFSGPIEKLINGESGVVAGKFEDIQDDDLQLHFIYVGQGDSTAIKLPDGKNILIDAGPKKSANDLTTYLDDVFFKGREKVIDYFILTHTDEDHTGGAVTILENYDVKAVYRPNVFSKSETVVGNGYQVTTAPWDNAVNAMSNADEVITIYKDLSLPSYTDPTDSSKDYTFNFYGPIQDRYNDKNDYSPVMMLENNGKKYMFTGDASESIEREFLDAYHTDLDTFDVDVLKVGHHGSATSTCKDFLDVVKPEWSVVSCGKDNKYGHPTNATINRLTDANSQILRTDVSGSLLLYESDGTIKYIADFFEPASYYVEWWYVVLALGIVAAVICFYPKSLSKALAKHNITISGSSSTKKSSTKKYK